MTILIFSSLLAVVSFFIAVKNMDSRYRALYAVIITAWMFFLLFFHMDAMVRALASNPPAKDASVNQFIGGILAYRQSLNEFRYSVMIVFLAAALLAIVPCNPKKP